MNDKETLEEVAEKFRTQNPGTMQGGNNTKILNAFKEGAKWQSEKSYSEEEVEDLILKYELAKRNKGNYWSDREVKEWFKQFKKK